MAAEYIQSSAIVRREMYRTHVKPRLDSGDLRSRVVKSAHPAKGHWQHCTASQIIEIYNPATNEQLALGHRHERYGVVFTRDGLDPKWVLHEDVIYGQ